MGIQFSKPHINGDEYIENIINVVCDDGVMGYVIKNKRNQWCVIKRYTTGDIVLFRGERKECEDWAKQNVPIVGEAFFGPIIDEGDKSSITVWKNGHFSGYMIATEGGDWQVFKNNECVYAGEIKDCKRYVRFNISGGQ